MQILIPLKFLLHRFQVFHSVNRLRLALQSSHCCHKHTAYLKSRLYTLFPFYPVIWEMKSGPNIWDLLPFLLSVPEACSGFMRMYKQDKGATTRSTSKGATEMWRAWHIRSRLTKECQSTKGVLRAWGMGVHTLATEAKEWAKPDEIHELLSQCLTVKI